MGSDMSSGFYGGFFGAIFAFFFGLLMHYITRKIKEFESHRNAIVKIEHKLQYVLDELSSVVHLSNIIYVNASSTTMTVNRFRNIILDDNITLELRNLDIVNKYFAFTRSVARLNADMVTTNAALNQLENVKMAKIKIDKQVWDNIKDNLISMRDYAALIIKLTIDLLSYIRVCIKKLDQIEYVERITYRFSDDICDEVEMIIERERVINEIDENKGK